MPTDNLKEKTKIGFIDGLYNTAVWLIAALAGTLVFIVFEMQAYTIPTGSMADTLHGAHFRLRCEQCAFRYDYDFIPEYYGLNANQTPGNNIHLTVTDPRFFLSTPPHRRSYLTTPPRCPSCGFFHSAPQLMPNGQVYMDSKSQPVPVIKGDRIFVLKCIYQFTEPKRWDVVVFKNPIEPKINYIKRMIALPGETVEIIDGDIYIDGKVARKPPKVQNELWMPVYNNDYQPVKPTQKRFGELGTAVQPETLKKWTQPFVNTPGSEWILDGDTPTVFTLDPDTDTVHTIVYDTTRGNNFKATYAYDNPVAYSIMPICSDLKIEFVADPLSAKGSIGAGLTKYLKRYRATVDADGTMKIQHASLNQPFETLSQGTWAYSKTPIPLKFSFENVDHHLVLNFGDNQLTYDFDTDPDAMGRPTQNMPEATIFASGKTTISHINIARDIHYIDSTDQYSIERAQNGNPFTLNEDEFFVCGDNSPNSADARLWNKPGVGNILTDGSRHEYRTGTVPRDYLVGKAFFVYWPGPHRPFNDTSLAKSLEKNPGSSKLKMALNVPFIDGMKIIYGGR